MREDHIPSMWIKMITSQNTASMNDKRSHTCYVNSNCQKVEYSINAWHKITYNLCELKWLEVRIQHQWMAKDHILAMGIQIVRR